MKDKKTILSINNLTLNFPIYKGIFKRKAGFINALRDINLTVKEGEILGIAGESGCGKTTLAKTIMGIIKFIQNDIFIKGDILFEQNDKMISLLNLTKKELRIIKAEMQMIFQDPFSSLNPRMTIYEILKEPLQIHQKNLSLKEKHQKINDIINNTGILQEQLGRYPHEFSGGQRQRIAIARTLLINPRFIIADEPVSALDVSIQAEILNLLSFLQKKFNLTYIFISHDLAVMKHIASKIAIMYLGEIVETGLTKEIFENPKHPYTKILINSIPDIDIDKKGKKFPVPDSATVFHHNNEGCSFFGRCKIAKKECLTNYIKTEKISDTHFVKCPYNFNSTIK